VGICQVVFQLQGQLKLDFRLSDIKKEMGGSVFAVSTVI